MKLICKVKFLSIFLLALLFIAFPQTSWAKRSIPDDLIVYSVLISLDDKNQSKRKRLVSRLE